MREAIICRVKMALWLAIFLSPVLIALWGQQMDTSLAENHYLPPLDPTIVAVANN